jgi:flagellar hook-associated protein 2
MAISTPGVGSGLDINGIVSQLMAFERRSLTAIDSKEAKFQTQLTAYGSLKGALSTFQSAVSALATPSKFNSVKTTVGDTAVATATATNAPTGSYSLEVQTLAQAQKLRSTTFTATTETVGTGTFTVSFGTYVGDTFTPNPDKASKEIVIAEGRDSLAAVRDAINAADAGVTATILNDGQAYRLVVTSKDTGVANAVRISVADSDGNNTDMNGLSRLAYDGRTISGVANLAQTVAAQNATALVDGIPINKASNSFSDVIEGVTLNLLKENTPSKTTVTVSRDTATIQASVQSFVKAYNDLNKTITDLTKYDATNKRASTLTGDATVRSLQMRLRNVFNTALDTSGGGFIALSDIGISFQVDGTLKLDGNKLTTVLADSTKDISTLFAAVAKPTDSLVAFSGSTADTKNGTYALNVSAIATQGKAVASGPALLDIVAGANDTLDVAVDGVSVSVTLAPGAYTAAGLAAEVQSKVNAVSGLSTADAGVSVTETGGVLTMTSKRYGSASTVAITGGNAKADLFGTPTETGGVDVAGMIGNSAATGTGQVLTGNGDAAGLAITVTGGVTGDRGTIKYARGYAYELDKLVGKLLENDSLLDGRMDGINASIKDIERKREQLNLRLENIEKRYRAQFNALDALMGRMQLTSTYLQQQLSSLPKPDALKKE